MKANLSIVASKVPWWGKIAAKVILARLPVNYRAWKQLHLFENGAMDEPSYAYGVYKKHFDRVQSRRILDRFVGLELGPGDSLLSAMVAGCAGREPAALDSGAPPVSCAARLGGAPGSTVLFTGLVYNMGYFPRLEWSADAFGV